MISHMKIAVANLKKPSFFEQILQLLDGRMKTPSLYGWFHLICLACVIGLCILCVWKAHTLTDKQLDTILIVTASVLIGLEIYKQLLFAYNPGDDTWEYEWYAFPFQFCSTPMYVMPAAYFVKNQKIRYALYAFLATFGFFGGTVVMIYPGDVFIELTGVNIQTMVHHGMMVVIAVLLYASGKVKFSHKTILHAIPVFVCLILTACILNEVYYQFGDLEQDFNMFYISPHFDCTLPLLSLLYPLMPYPAFLIMYVVGFGLAGYVLHLIAWGVSKLYKQIKEKQAQLNRQ